MINKTVILLDIDETIFATDKYKKELAEKLFPELGYSSLDEFSPIFNELLEETIVARLHFDPVYFIEAAYIVRKKEITLERLDEIFWDTSLFADKLYPDVIKVLETLSQRDDIELGILSTGDQKHQRAKIASITHFFTEDNINIFPDKIAVLEDVLKKYQDFKIVIVDDRREVLERALLLNPSVKAVLIYRSEKGSGSDSDNEIFVIVHDILSLIN